MNLGWPVPAFLIAINYFALTDQLMTVLVVRQEVHTASKKLDVGLLVVTI